MIKKFVDAFTKNLDQALNEKTNWGRNDIKALVLSVINKTLMDIME